MPKKIRDFGRLRPILFCLVTLALGVLVRETRSKAGHPGSKDFGFHFVDVTSEMGIHFNYETPEISPDLKGKERIAFFGAGVSVLDVDGDGWMDILFLASKKGERNHLYINQQGHGFIDKAEEWKIAENPPDLIPTSALVFDYNNDGRPDLFISGLGCSRLLKNEGTYFSDQTSKISSKTSGKDCRNSIAANAIDYNHDGLLDIYILRYWGPEPFDKLANGPNNYFNATNGGVNTLLKNNGDGTFTEVDGDVAAADSHWTLDATFGDFLGDRMTKLYLANDYGPDAVYSLNGDKFVDQSSLFKVPDRRFGMSSSLGDLSGTGLPHIFVSNEYISNYNQTGNFLWSYRKAHLEDEAPQRKVDQCGWAWGSYFGDFNLDGKEDLYVANGFVTGEKGADDVYPLFYGMMRKNAGYEFVSGTMMSSAMEFFGKYKNWPKLLNRSWAGNEVGCLFLNKGDSFENVSEDVGLGQSWDGRAVAGIDFDNKGSLDLVITTQDGPAHLLKNMIEPHGHWIGISLVGTKSNRDGTGSKLEVIQNGKRQYRWSTGGRTGFMANSDARIHFGLATEDPVDINIFWPSGRVTALKQIKTGQYLHVTEGP